ncbi:MAG: RES family NAD+ phosphorylase [Pseudomonadota bacterium]
MPHFKKKPYNGTVWRFVEAQHVNSTMKLVDSERAQETLEQLLDDTKPPVPAECRHLHYLLFTPFRYEAIYATRFRRVGQPQGVFYCAETVETAAAEVAFYKLLFFFESPGTPIPVEPFELSAFSVPISTLSAWDLTGSDTSKYRAPNDYGPCHVVADDALRAGVEAIRYASARHDGGRNLAVFSCQAFAKTEPTQPEAWKFRLSKDRVRVRKSFGPGSFEFLVETYAKDARITL